MILRIQKTQNNINKMVIACDGNLWRKHPTLQKDVHGFLDGFLRDFGDVTEVRFNISTMSSGPGAAACCFGKLWE